MQGHKGSNSLWQLSPNINLECFYKLASCVIAQRIKPAVNHIVGRQQKAYIGNNNMYKFLHMIINLINMMSHCNNSKKHALILLIDFKKAFDSIDQAFMQSFLKMLGFGDDIR